MQLKTIQCIPSACDFSVLDYYYAFLGADVIERRTNKDSHASQFFFMVVFGYFGYIEYVYR